MKLSDIRIRMSLVDESKDPQEVWRIVHNSIKSLLVAKKHEVEKLGKP